MPKNYILRNVDDELWQRIKIAAVKQNLTVRQMTIDALELIANKYAPPLDKSDNEAYIDV